MRDPETITNESFPVAIFSTFRPETAENNDIIFDRLASSLRQFNFKFNEAVGCYKGERERSFVIVPAREEHFLYIAALHDQESILFVDAAHAPGQRLARLVDCESGEEIARGPFYSTTEADAKSRDAYTYVPSTGAYFVADLDFA